MTTTLFHWWVEYKQFSCLQIGKVVQKLLYNLASLALWLVVSGWSVYNCTTNFCTIYINRQPATRHLNLFSVAAYYIFLLLNLTHFPEILYLFAKSCIVLSMENISECYICERSCEMIRMLRFADLISSVWNNFYKASLSSVPQHFCWWNRFSTKYFSYLGFVELRSNTTR